MSLALEEALKAYRESEIPIGAVLINEDGILIAREHNRIEQLNDATAHAEILVLREGSRKLNRR
ncbi:MAG: nucleoside deaminase, partial [Selenomonadaceae bacterium]|nr:nucleoside deaminase [Selenomonadaceae bacterium]